MGWMRSIDIGVVQAFNALARKSPALDQVVAMFESNALLKTGLLVGLLWIAWFSARDRAATRRLIVRTLLAAFVAIVVARVAQRALPERPRPIYVPELRLHVTHDLDLEGHADQSSFPSDHAVLMCAVATGLWMMSRRYGILAFGWILCAVFTVRLYTGLHYPSDLIAGGLLGIGIMGLVAGERRFTPGIVAAVMTTESRHASAFYTIAFFLTWQVATLFGECRQVARVLWTIASRHY